MLKNDDYYVAPISTQDAFKQSPDDMIPYWEDDGKIIFSDELWEWFGELKKKFELILSDDIEIRNPLKYMALVANKLLREKVFGF